MERLNEVLRDRYYHIGKRLGLWYIICRWHWCKKNIIKIGLCIFCSSVSNLSQVSSSKFRLFTFAFRAGCLVGHQIPFSTIRRMLLFCYIQRLCLFVCSPRYLLLWFGFRIQDNNRKSGIKQIHDNIHYVELLLTLDPECKVPSSLSYIISRIDIAFKH